MNAPAAAARPRMSTADLTARARSRADAEHLHTWAVEPGRLYLVKSRKLAPGSHHMVRVNGDAVGCDCPGDVYRGPGVCTHCYENTRYVYGV